MKQNTIIRFFVLSVLLSLAGCRQHEIEPAPEALLAGTHYLTATLEHQASTRSQLGHTEDDRYYAFWTDKDELAVYVDGLENPDRYILSEGAGTAMGKFAGTVAGERYIALYPYSDRVNQGLQDKSLSLELPAVQTYAPGSFGEGAFPMIAVGEGSELPFKNLCAVLKISLTGETAIKSIRFVAHDASMAVSGPATVRTDYADAPELVMAEGGEPKVTLDCGCVFLSDGEPTDFYLAIPAGTYRGGFSVEIESFSGTVTREITSDVTFLRSQFRYIAPFRCEPDGQIDPDDIPHNQIWYTTYYNNPVEFSSDAFDRSIVSQTFSDGKGVVVFDGPVTKVGSYAFRWNALTSVTLPNSVETIESYAFWYNQISSFHTPERLKSVEARAFAGCSSLARIYGPLASADEKALILEDGTLVAYAMASAGPELTIPPGTISLAPSVFYDQDGIRDVILPEGLLTIGDQCFFDNGALETVTLPSTLTEVGGSAFVRCPSLRLFKGESSLSPDGHALINPGGELQAFAGAGITDYVIPEMASSFTDGVFYNNKTLHSLTFPKLSFSSIWLTDYFSGCDNLEYFYGPGTTDDHHCLIIWGDMLFAVTKVLPADYSVPSGYGIGRTNFDLFAGNSTVEHLSFPDDIYTLGDYLFYGMSRLKTVRLPSGLVSLGSNAFAEVTTLDTLYLRSFAPPSYSESRQSGLARDGLVICVPRGFESLYKSSSSWSKYADNIQGYVYDDLADPDYYISKDYSQDGVVTTLQTASAGKGIDIVLMGDGFSDRQIADGTYASVMRKMADAFFSEEPYASYRDLFNVQAVNVVSATEGYDHPGQALAGWFGDGTLVGGDDGRCQNYALKAVPEDRMDNTLVIVAMNSPAYGGTCYMYYPHGGDYGSGLSIAYFPVGQTDEGLAQLVHHEAGGHGFAKLADEYAYDNMGTIPEPEIKSREANVPYGWWKNCDFTNDPTKVKWSIFLSDTRYRYDGLGCFEGGFTYWRGVWRPTENSIMRYNTGGYNAPSREAIWYRMHKLAYGENWNYDYEAFVSYDAKNRKSSASASAAGSPGPRLLPIPTHPPVVVPRRWDEPAPVPGPTSSHKVSPSLQGRTPSPDARPDRPVERLYR